MVVHGEDFTALGSDRDVDWFRSKKQKRFEVKIMGHIGPDPGDQKSIRILNRVVAWTPKGITYEMDKRHAEIIVATLGPLDSKAVSTSGISLVARKL